jgi:hypothetical protein
MASVGTTPQLEVKNFASPDETQQFVDGKGNAEAVSIAGRTVKRLVCPPGWRWSTNVGALTGLTSCPVTHLYAVQSGRLRIRFADGGETEIKAGDVAVIPAEHDGESVGDEDCVLLDFGQFLERATTH